MKQEKLPCPTEAVEQTWLFRWAYDMSLLRWPELSLMHHIANGGSRDYIEAKHLKQQGVKPGIPDIFLPVAKGGYHGLYIEMKRQHGGRLSEEQKDVIPRLRAQGYRVEVCKGFQVAANTIEAYMEGRLKNA